MNVARRRLFARLVVVGVLSAVCGCGPRPTPDSPTNPITKPPESQPIGNEPIGNGPTSDKPQQSSPRDAAGRPVLPLLAMSVEEFNAWWQIDLEVQEQPLGQVLEQLVAKIPDWTPEIFVAAAEQQ